MIAAVHTYDKVRTVNGGYGERRVAAPGPTVRVRLINTDNGPMATWVDGAPYKVVAVDGNEVNAPPEVSGKTVLVTAGGRIDLQVTIPQGSAVRIGLGGGPTTLVIGDGNAPTGTQPRDQVDLLTYGSPKALGFDPAKATGCSSTTSGGGSGSSTASPDCGGRSTGISTRTCRCSW